MIHDQVSRIPDRPQDGLWPKFMTAIIPSGEAYTIKIVVPLLQGDHGYSHWEPIDLTLSGRCESGPNR
jgi:hypothetical protein